MIQVVTENTTTNTKWVDIIDPSKEELDQIAQTYNLHSTSVQDCLDPIHLPKYEKIEETKFIIVRAADENAATDADSMQDLTRKIAIFLHDKTLITIHRKDQPFLRDLREKWKKSRGDSQNKSLYILIDLLKRVLISYEPQLVQAEDLIETFEHNIFKNRAGEQIIEKLYFLKHRVGIYKRMIRSTLENIHKIDEVPRAVLPILQDLREEGDRIYLFVDQSVEDVNNLLNIHVSLSTHKTNEIMRVLTLFSVFFMPLTFIVGIYGMNFHHMPELAADWGYPAVWVFMMLVTATLFIWFRSKGWLK